MTKHITSVEGFFNRYNVVIFFTLAAVITGISIFLCYQVYTGATDISQSDIPQEVNINFDQPTARRIDELHTSDQAAVPNLPGGRLSPFVE